MRVQFNANEQVRVKLNERGEAILRKQHADLVNATQGRYDEPFVLKLDEEGYYRAQLWSLRQTFGPHMTLGSLPPFDLDIVLGGS